MKKNIFIHLIFILYLSSIVFAKQETNFSKKQVQKLQQLKNIKLHNTQLSLEQKYKAQQNVKEKKLSYEKLLTKKLKKHPVQKQK